MNHEKCRQKGLKVASYLLTIIDHQLQARSQNGMTLCTCQKAGDREWTRNWLQYLEEEAGF